MNHTITHSEKDGIHTYFHNGVEYIRDITEYPYATIYESTDGCTWVFPTRTRRKGTSKALPANAQFVAIVKAD